MALETVKLPRLDAMTRLVSDSGAASITFSQWWNEVAGQIEGAINGINQALNEAAAAQTAANSAQGAADDAQNTADSATALANTKVTKDAGPAWTDATGTAARTAYATYSAGVISNPPTQAEVQAVADALALLSPHFTAVVNDLKANGALT